MSELNDNIRFSKWAESVEGRTRGPKPYPSWLVTGGDSIEYERGIVRTGKEAEAFLLEKSSIEQDKSCLLLAKRYKPRLPTAAVNLANNGPDRQIQGSREKRAIARRSRFGIDIEKSEWAGSEFRFLCEFYSSGLSVPYPVQWIGREIVMEWIGEEDGSACPRVCDVDLFPNEATDIYEQMVSFIIDLARLGYAHGDLSPYNALLRANKVVVIDFPQVVDIAKNPVGQSILARDCQNVTDWFTQRGVTTRNADELFSAAIAEAWTF